MFRMERAIGYFCLIVLYHVTICCGLGPKCYTCSNVPTPRDCNRVSRCADGEVCYLRKLKGSLQNDYYEMGCMANNNTCSQHNALIGKRRTESSAHAHPTERWISTRASTTQCQECCSDDYCNLHSGLCGTDLPSNIRCFDCNGVSDPAHCDRITECDPQNVCDVIQKASMSQSDHSSCLKCCNDRDLCNGDCGTPNVLGYLISEYASSTGHIRSAKFKRFGGYYFKSENVQQEVVLRHAMACVSYCDYVIDCVAVAWNENTRVCQLSFLDITNERLLIAGMNTGSEWLAAVNLRYKVFNRQGPGRYSLNFTAAISECSDHGYVIADPADMREARDAGFDDCICGWVSDGTNVVILQFYDSPCWHSYTDGYELCNKELADVFCKLNN